MVSVIAKNYRLFVLILLILGIILYAANIPALKVDIDESWFGEQAYYLAEDGIVKSEMFGDFLRYDEQILVYHKIFIWAGAKFINLFGFSLYSLRMISILSALLLIGIIYFFCKRYYNIAIFKMALVILLFCPLMFRNTILYRPEIMLCLTGFLSFYAIYKYLESKNQAFLIISALLAGLSVLVHLNGLIFIGAGAILLLSEKKWGQFFIFGIISMLIASFYFYDALGNMELFKLQFMSDPSNAGDNIRWYMPAKNLINEHKRLFRKPEIIGITSLFLLSAFYWIKNKWNERKRLIIYTVFLIILLGILNHNKTTKYAILMFPYFALMSAENIYLLIKEPIRIKSIVQKIFLVMLVLTLIVGIQFDFQSILIGKENWVEKHQAVASHIPKGSKILAPMPFMYNEISNYDIVGLLPAKIMLDRQKKEFTPGNLCDLAEKYSCEFIIIDSQYCKMLGCDINDTTCMESGPYKYNLFESGYYIYKDSN